MFMDLFELANRDNNFKKIQQQEAKIKVSQRKNLLYKELDRGVFFVQEGQSEVIRFAELDAAKIVGKNPFTCKALILLKSQQSMIQSTVAALKNLPAKGDQMYSFDNTQLDAIFEYLRIDAGSDFPRMRNTHRCKKCKRRSFANTMAVGHIQPVIAWYSKILCKVQSRNGYSSLEKKKKEATKVEKNPFQFVVGINMVSIEVLSSSKIGDTPGHQDDAKVVLTKPNMDMAYHLKPLFVQGHLDKVPVTRMMVDNRAAMNILPANMVKRLGKTTKDLIPTDIVVSSFTGVVANTWGILPIDVIVGSHAEVVKANLKPFMAEVHTVEAVYYHSNIDPH
ncbi:hypothetical protein ACH5RR_022944 [Cinchona calisaya]|uniref:Uncharacterized protein n=1 Tax=Cinchona calisaya TaxID=153742 RepID=A0ABD2Z991_9GENT